MEDLLWRLDRENQVPTAAGPNLAEAHDWCDLIVIIPMWSCLLVRINNTNILSSASSLRRSGPMVDKRYPDEMQVRHR